MVVTQIPIEAWHERIPDPTLADAILDRLVNNAYRLQLTGESQRRLRSFTSMSALIYNLLTNSVSPLTGRHHSESVAGFTGIRKPEKCS
jgi:hypothetical protein